MNGRIELLASFGKTAAGQRPSVLLAAGMVALMAAGVWAQAPAAPVETAPVIVRKVSAGQTFVGTVRPLRRATIGSAVEGRVIEFPVDVGQRVEEGRTLAQLLTDTISLEIEAAEAELALRESELTELQNGSRPEEIEQTRARMEASAALKDYRAKRRSRVEKLLSENATSEETWQEAISASIAADETHLETKAAWQMAVAGPREEKKLQAIARRNLQQALLDKLIDQRNKHTVVSRFTGYVTQEFTEVGAWVGKGDPVAEIIELDKVEIEAFVLDTHAAHVELGEDVLVAIPALTDHVFRGEVIAIVPQSDERTRTFPVRVLVSNQIVDGQPLIKAGMLARVTLPTGTAQNATLVPKDALVLGGAAPLLFVVVADEKNPQQHTVRPVAVDLGVASGDLIQVLPPGGSAGAIVQPGQQVVVMGNERLRPGQPVIIAPSGSGRKTTPPGSGAP